MPDPDSDKICPNCHEDCGGDFVISETGVRHCRCYWENNAADIYFTRDPALIQLKIDKKRDRVAQLRLEISRYLEEFRKIEEEATLVNDEIAADQQELLHAEQRNAEILRRRRST